MGSFIKFLLIFIIIYISLKWLKSYLLPSPKKNINEGDVRIFKKGNVEKPKVKIKDAETIEFEEIDQKN